MIESSMPLYTEDSGVKTIGGKATRKKKKM